LAEQRSPKPQVGGSIPSWPAIYLAPTKLIPMESSSRQASTRFDAVKWVVVVAVIAVGVVGNYYFGNESLLYRTLAMVALALVAGFIALQTDKGRRLAQLMKEAKVEIRKVVWPTRQELLQTTAIVLAFVLLVALLLWGMDSLVAWIVSSMIG